MSDDYFDTTFTVTIKSSGDDPEKVRPFIAHVLAEKMNLAFGSDRVTIKMEDENPAALAAHLTHEAYRILEGLDPLVDTPLPMPKIPTIHRALCDLCKEPLIGGMTLLNGHKLHSKNAVPGGEKQYGDRTFPTLGVSSCRDRWIRGERP